MTRSETDDPGAAGTTVLTAAAIPGQEEELRDRISRVQRLEAISMLVGGIAHDLKNMLVPVVALSESLLRQAAPGCRDRECLELIHRNSTSCRDLLNHVLAFARGDDIRPIPLDLSAFVAGALPPLRTIVSPIAIRESLEPVPEIMADGSQIDQILFNLVTNAAHAIGARRGEIAVEVFPSAKGIVQLSVIDDGGGMDEATRQRVFEPFFTTKGATGTGLGLSNVFHIVKNLGGSISLRTGADCGTQVNIALPAASLAAQSEARRAG